MKKIIALTLAVLMLLSLAACGTKEEAAPVATEAPVVAEPVETTPEPTPTEPEWEPGVARAGYGELVYTTLNRGDIVNVIGQWKDYYIVEGDEVDLLILKSYLRLDSEGEYESWTGYARWGAQAFDNVKLEGDSILDLYVNQQVTVVDGKDGWLYIEWEGGSGYIDEEYISEYYIDAGSGGGSSGGSGGGGGDINLDLVAYFGPAKEDMKEMALVLADNVEAYLCITVRGDELKVTSVNDEECEIWMEGFTATVPRWLMHMDGDEEYEAWTGYSYSGSIVYEEYQMRNELMTLDFNTEVTVLDKLPDCYVVEVDEQIGYVNFDDIAESYIVVYSGGGGGGGGGGVWTPPVV